MKPNDNNTNALCINCSNLKTCVYCRNPLSPVIYCEEFTCEAPCDQTRDMGRLENLNQVPPGAEGLRI